IEVRFDTTGDANEFGQRIGLRQGVQTSTYSLESKIPAPVVITTAATGKIERSGLIEGNFTKNQSVFNTAPRAIVPSPVAQTEAVSITGADANDEYSVVINGRTFKSSAAATTSEDKRNDLITQINDADDLGVHAVAGRSIGEMHLVADTAGTPFTLSVSGNADNAGSINTETLAKNQISQSKPLNLNDLTINGIKIRATTNLDDQTTASPAASSDQSASALAIAAAINSNSAETGVRAQANPVVIKGSPATTSLPAIDTTDNQDFYDLYVNGTKVSVQFVQNEDPRTRADKVVKALNQVSHLTGVAATNNGGGVSLESDGRNVSLWFDSSRPDVSAASFGLDQGGATAQVSKIKLSGTSATTTEEYGIRINGTYVHATVAATAAETADALAAAIQSAIDDGTLTNIAVSTNNGEIEISSTVPGSPFTLDGATVRDATGAGTFPDDYDVAEGEIAMDLSTVAEKSNGSNVVTAIFNASETSTSARTAYGTVRLISDPALLPKLPSPIGAPPSDQLDELKATGRPFTIQVGDNGFVDAGNFSELGFQEGTFGGRSSEDMDPPRVGRLAFQVGSSANQYITIDLADFGKAGSITGELTGDIDKNVEDRNTRINTREGASSVLRILDDAMDKVNATRATMGAVMNRLEHVITNLSNVSTNLSASRSQIEDADYAQASTELAKTQIMQQAATAVLAQANTSQQTVLKLLGG
ncbi:MAG: A-type flagellin, partial [Pseudomonadota bacterium]